MAGYGNYNRGNYGGGYNRGGYNNQGGQGGYAQNAPATPAPQPIDIHQEIVTRLDLYLQFKDVALNEKGITPDEFLMMNPMLGGWVTSILLKQEKGK